MLKKIRGLARRVRSAHVRNSLSTRAQKVRDDRLTYLTPEKLYRIEWYLDKTIPRVPGDVIELGVYLGGAGIVMAAVAEREGRKFHGFDVFTMIPEPSSENDDDFSKEAYRKITTGNFGGIGDDPYYGHEPDFTGRVKANFARHGVPIDGDKRTLHKGLFEETLPNYSSPVAFAHIDCDWYDPVKLCLEEISKRLSPGGVMILDDYHAWAGARRATDEFLARNRGRYRFIDGENVVLLKAAS